MKKLNDILIIYFFIVVSCSISCDNPEEENFKLYAFLNQDYLPLLDKDTFPRNIRDRVLDIRYDEMDTIIIDGLCFLNPGNRKGLSYYDYSFKWNFDSLKNCRKIDSICVMKCPKTNIDTFRTLFGKGYVTLSKPIVSDSFLLIKEYRDRSNLLESYENEAYYLIFKKNKNKWELKLKKKIEVMY